MSMVMSNNEKICSLLKGLPDQALTQIAQYFSVLAEPTRLRILNTLRASEKNVGNWRSFALVLRQMSPAIFQT
jgi:DNA-binding transcriptional ArsR family regulator